ncbi:MFS general substrate transporter [Tothia fuscella]|uniref:MFS general substrate transporter n=1 Tax=Tothia fuscella TaxID=1048955 RepID=A0A9P4NH48_9PEZI|nr:MFS general substrate transporter [Tothia fuscella]
MLDIASLEALPWYKRPSVYWLLVPFAFSALAMGGVIVPKVNLVLNLICHRYLKEHSSLNPSYTFSLGRTDDHCRVPEVQRRVSIFKLAMSAISGSLAAVVAPKLGELSDRYGRTKMLVWNSFMMIIMEIITILAAQFPDTVSVYWILIGALFDGMGGSFIAAMAISHSFAADCTPSSQRSVVFGYFHGCLFTGIAVGPIIAGYIVKLTGDIISMFYIAAGIHISFVFLLLFVVPESVPKMRQLTAREKHREDIESQITATWLSNLRTFNLFAPLKILTGTGASPSVRRNLIVLAATDTIVFGVGMGAAVVILLYSNYAFGWDQWEQSKFITIMNSSRVSGLLFFLPAVTHWYRRRHPPPTHGRTEVEGVSPFELSVIRFAILADTLGFLGYALAQDGSQFLLCGAIAGIGGIASPSMQAALTKHVPKEKIGQLLGAMGLLHAVARVIGPTLFTGIYAATVSFFPRAYFMVLTSMFCVAYLVSWQIRPGGE